MMENLDTAIAILGTPVITALITGVFSVIKDKKGKLGKIEKKLDEHINLDDARNAVGCRVRILRFGDEMREGRRHSEEHFLQCLEDIRVYKSYCDDHPDFPNDKTVVTSKMIKEQYEECLRKGEF